MIEYVLAGSNLEYVNFVLQMAIEKPGIDFYDLNHVKHQLGMPRGSIIHLVGTAHFRKNFGNEFRFMLQYTNNIVDHTLARYGIVYVPTVGLAYELAKRLGFSEEGQHLSEKSLNDGVPNCR